MNSMNREALYSGKPSPGIHAHHMALRHACVQCKPKGTNAHAFDTIGNPLTWWLLRLLYHIYTAIRLTAILVVTPELPEPKQNINVGRHARAH